MRRWSTPWWLVLTRLQKKRLVFFPGTEENSKTMEKLTMEWFWLTPNLKLTITTPTDQKQPMQNDHQWVLENHLCPHNQNFWK